MRERDGSAGALHDRTREALAALGESARQGDRDRQPPRLGSAPRLSLVRLGGRVPRMRRLARRPPRRPAVSLPSLRPRGTAARLVSRLRLGDAGACRGGNPADRGADRRRHGGLPVFRLDADTTAGVGGHLEILAAFEAAEAGVLVGTQMVAKGHDFPDVVLAVVVDADSTLRFPDFRAEERTFALVAQLAGRSGRGERPGRVIVQTMTPDAPAIVHAAAHDAAGFVEGELARRRELGYPPFAHVIRIELGRRRRRAAADGGGGPA